MEIIDNVALILGILVGGCTMLLTIWAVRVNGRVTDYEKSVRKLLLELQCPLYDFDMMLDGYHTCQSVETTAHNIVYKWERIKSKNGCGGL